MPKKTKPDPGKKLKTLKEKIVKMLKKEKSIPDIAATTGYKQKYVQEIIDRFDLEPNLKVCVLEGKK